GLLDLKRSTVLVYVQTVDGSGRLVPVQANYRNIIGEENLGIDQQLRDPDAVSREFGEMHAEGTAGQQGEVIPTLASQMIIGMGRDTSAGFIDYSLGAPLEYVPIHAVKDMSDEELKRRFAGRVVLIGTLMGQTDRWRLPVKLLEIGRAH